MVTIAHSYIIPIWLDIATDMNHVCYSLKYILVLVLVY